MNRATFLRQAALALLAPGTPAAPLRETGLRGAYIDPRYQTAVGFGQTSPYLQSWRAYSETLPTSALTDASGVMLNLQNENPDVICRHLAACGIRYGRIEIGWSTTLTSDESALDPGAAASLRPLLLACRANHIRPLILLNSNHGYPCPMTVATHTLAAPARKGDRHLLLRDAGGLRAGYSGLNDVLPGKACDPLFAAVAPGGRIMLSRPLPKDLGRAGDPVTVGTLRYRPFGAAGTPEYAETRGGWQRYALAAARFAAKTLAPSGGSDRGFDIEIWNELSFGSDFRDINLYYDPPLFPSGLQMTTDLVRAVAEVAVAHADTFAGVTLCDGFSNTIPWTASSGEPVRVAALSKHPYAGSRTYAGKPEQAMPVVNALFVAEEKPGFYPSYTALFPEYWGNALQTETITRDLSPISTSIYGGAHGRFARIGANGTPVVCQVWFTEWGLAPNEVGVSAPDAAGRLKAKMYARALLFYVGKGLRRLYFYGAVGRDNSLGIVSERFAAVARQPSPEVRDDKTLRSPVLTMLDRLTRAFAGAGGDAGISAPAALRPLRVDDIRDTHGHFQWLGDGTPAHPTLYNRECVVFQPFQAGSARFVIVYYVQTRDVRETLPPENYLVIVSGLAHPRTATLSRVYDPVDGVEVAGARVAWRNGRGQVAFFLPATDSPRLLFLNDS